jgi:GntR family transcriptional regulator
MPYEYTPPKYARVIEELQQRIESGVYPPGSMLPSEHQLREEFQVARPTVVRALRVLRDNGWIDTQQGKGSFVRGRPALAGLDARRPGEDALNRAESDETGDPIEVTRTSPPVRIGRILGIADDADVIARRRLVRLDGEPSELVTWWIPAAVADGSDLAGADPVPGGVRAHVARRKGVRIDHVLEQVIARHPVGEEAKLLGVSETAAMLVLYVTGCDAAGAPVMVLQIVLPGELHELEDAYQVG